MAKGYTEPEDVNGMYNFQKKKMYFYYRNMIDYMAELHFYAFEIFYTYVFGYEYSDLTLVVKVLNYRF